MGVRIQTLGCFRVTVADHVLPEDGWRRRKARQLLKCILSRPRHRLGRDAVIEWLWPGSDPEAAAVTLRSTIHALRTTLHAAGLAPEIDPINVDRDGIGLASIDVWVDADEFERLLAAAGTADEPLSLLEAANALYAGEYLPDDLYEVWASDRRRALERAWTTLKLALADHRERGGDIDGAVAALECLLEADRCDERAGQELLRLLLRHGRRSDASRVYRRLVGAVREDLGVDPSGATLALGRELDAPPSDAEERPTRLLTFLLTDIEGSVALWERDGDAMRRACARHDALVEASVGQRRGEVVRMHGEGDSRFAVFAQPGDAVAAACDLQDALRREPWPTVTPLRVRMALHTDEAVERAGQFYGSAVNRCARLRALARGGQVLLSEATAGLVRGRLPDRAELRDRGEHPLRGIERPERVFELVRPGLGDDGQASGDALGRPGNVPTSLTALIGREAELDAVRAALLRDGVCLVTLTGPGGVGKTRLALEIARHLAGHFPDGAYFVSLAPIRDPALVPSVVAQAVGMREMAAETLTDGLRVHLRDRRLLLVLDNFEHVLAAASLVTDLLESCAGLTVLATSRASLHLSMEREFPVPPLSLPAGGPPASAVDRLLESEAGRLFVERACASRPNFAPTTDDAATVGEICRRLDGLPLAIELAAARVKLLPPQALLARLERRLAVLVGGPRDRPDRQRTLRDAIAWSYNLLSPDEQRAFQRLAAFVGGCTLGAAEAVCNMTGEPATGVLDELAALVDNSLLRQVDGTGSEPRFAMLETIREYALERLDESGEGPAARSRHAAFYLAFAEEAERGMRGPPQSWWLDRLEAEHDNLRAAYDWLLACRESEAGLRLGAALARFWFVRGYLTEGRDRLARILACDEKAPSTRARAAALHGLGSLAQRQGDFVAARAPYEEALTIHRAHDDTLGVAESLNRLGALAHDEGEYAASRALHEESLTLRRALGDRWGTAASLHNLGTLAHRQGELAPARALYEEALAIWRELGASLAIASGVTNLGRLAQDERDYVGARAQYEEGLLIRRELGEKPGILGSLGQFAWLAVEQEVPEAARRPATERAVTLFGALETLRDSLSARFLAGWERNAERELAKMRDVLGEAAFEAAWSRGRAMSLDEAIAYALASAP